MQMLHVKTGMLKNATAFAVAVVLASPALANGSAEVRIKTAIESNTAGKVAVSSVAPTPVAGIYEITSGLDVFYVDSTGRYSFVDGRLVDMKTSKDLTAIRLAKLSSINFKDLPLNLAVKTVQGNGTRVLAVFEDPACPICRSLHKFLSQLPDSTVYTFMYPVVSPDSIPKAQAAWCAPDRMQAWSGLMQGGQTPPMSKPCDTSGLTKIVALGDKLNIAGTPTVFLSDGRRLVGALPPDQLITAIDEAAHKK